MDIRLQSPRKTVIYWCFMEAFKFPLLNYFLCLSPTKVDKSIYKKWHFTLQCQHPPLISGTSDQCQGCINALPLSHTHIFSAQLEVPNVASFFFSRQIFAYQPPNNNMDTLLIMNIWPLVYACFQLVLLCCLTYIFTLHSATWLGHLSSASTVCSKSAGKVLLPRFFLLFLSFLGNPAYPLLPRFWPFNSLLNQSEGSLA